jgi:hypothetical protein
VEIERLSFIVTPEERTDDFIDADAMVWNPWLQQQRGYIRKTANVYPGGRVDLRIYWASKRDLDAASKNPELPALDVKLRSQFLGVYQRLP